MVNVTHASLTGADLHEPKGVSTAASGTVYVANGTGSGTWTPASSVITNTSWTTGDVKSTFQASAPSGWILFAEGGTIGDGSSGATVLASSTTQALYYLFWNTFPNTVCPVSGGRGTSASADYSAHKTLQLPPMASRALGVAGSGTGLTSRALGATVGGETVTLVTANLPPYTPAGSIASNLTAFNSVGASIVNGQTGAFGVYGGGGTAYNFIGFINATITSTWTGTAQGGTSTPFSSMEPTVFLNLLIKL